MRDRVMFYYRKNRYVFAHLTLPEILVEFWWVLKMVFNTTKVHQIFRQNQVVCKIFPLFFF